MTDSITGDEFFLVAKKKYEINDFQSAIKNCSKAIEINPNYAEEYNRRGLSKRAIEDSKGACEDLKKAAELGSKEAAELFKNDCKN